MNTVIVQQVSKKKLESTLNKIYNIPALPDIVSDALKLLNSKKTNNQQLIKIISKGQSFVAKVLANANSSIYGLRKEVSIIDFAIMILGYNELRHIVFVISFMESFKGKSDRHFNQNSFWLHSLITANISKKIAEDIGYEKISEAFVSGFLHDFGIQIMHRHFRGSFISIVNLVKDQGLGFLEAEEQVLRVSHADIAKYLMDSWSFPSNLINAAAYHHDPCASKKDKLLPAIIHVADYLTQQINGDSYAWENGCELDKSVCEIFNKTEEEFNQFIVDYIEQFESEEKFAGLLS